MTRHPVGAALGRGPFAAGWLTALAAVAAVTAVVAGLVVGPLGAPAGAHGDKGIITVEASHPAGATAVHYIVRVTFENDGDPAGNATVTATAVGDDGTPLTPVTLAPADDDGRYAGVVEFPEAGSWTVRFASLSPTGTAERAEEVAPAAATEPADDNASADDASAEDDADSAAGFAPADDGTGSSTESAAASDDGDFPLWLILVALAVVVVGAVVARAIVRRYRTEADAESAQFDALEASRASQGGASTGATSAPPSPVTDPTTRAQPGRAGPP